MKKTEKNQGNARDLSLLAEKFSKNQELNESAMQSVKGGDGDGGSDQILFPPKPPEEGN